MHFSSFNENYLKNNLDSENKEECIMQLTKQIEEKEAEMYDELNTGYLSVINKCSKLESLTNYMQNIQVANTEFGNVTNELILRTSNMSDERATISDAISRIEEVKHEFKIVQNFIAKRNKFPNLKFNNKESKVSYFHAVESLMGMKNMLEYFKKYNFFMPLNQVYRDFYTQFIMNVKENINDWLENIPYVEIGGDVKVQTYRNSVFDSFDAYRSKLVGKQFLKIHYAARELSIEPLVVETINNKRLDLGFAFERGMYKAEKKKGTVSSLLETTTNNSEEPPNQRDIEVEHPKNIAKDKESTEEEFIKINQPRPIKIQTYSDATELFYSLTSNILLSYFLKGFYHNIQTYYDEIFEQIEGIKFTNYDMIKETLMPFKKLCTVLKLDTEKLDAVLEKIAHDYYTDDQNRENLDYMYEYIDNSVHFLQEITQFNNELDEMLASNVDKDLQKYFYEHRTDDVEEFTKFKLEIYRALDYLKGKEAFFETKNYEIENIIYSAEEKFVKKKVEDILSNRDIKVVVNKIVKLKESMDKVGRRKVIREVETALREYYTGDDLILLKDTIRRNYKENQE